ncbi:unnamed protein product [Cyprideis torosa]|uniref:Uncharacterized protein n=1 Tax=Cyprideis torosa TaxID=163714 RepID=A0A7R8WL65_9CRUS|nr:unnamed protein product [Cyprideis torosa]CAG0904010.1 unnamed protein product [Cyprideis torosa]
MSKCGRGKIVQHLYKGRKGLQLLANVTIGIYGSPNTMQCAMRCNKEGEACQAYNFHLGTETCTLYSDRYCHDAPVIFVDDGSHYHEKDWTILYQINHFDPAGGLKKWNLAEKHLALKNGDTISVECQKVLPTDNTHYLALLYASELTAAQVTKEFEDLKLARQDENGAWQTFQAPTSFSDLISAGVPYIMNVTCTSNASSTILEVKAEKLDPRSRNPSIEMD